MTTHQLLPVNAAGEGPARYDEIAKIVCGCGVDGCRRFFDGVHVLILEVQPTTGELWWHCRCGWMACRPLPSPTAGQKAHDEAVYGAKRRFSE